jgi:TRAP-type C4-dicarboxylate transport system permease small subunit
MARAGYGDSWRMPILVSAGKALDRGSRIACGVAGWLLAGMAVLINVEIVLRYVFNSSTLVADEYSGYLFVWSTLLGFGYALQNEQFLKVETLVSRFGPRGQQATAILAAVAGLVVAAVCTYATGALFYSSWRFATASIQPSATPLWLPQIILPVAFAGLCVIYVHQALRAIHSLRKPGT